MSKVMKNINAQKEDIKTQPITRLIPEGELKCVWMTAGLVAYKLCDQEYNCEFCSFNEAFWQERNFSTIGQAIKNEKEEVESTKTPFAVTDIPKGLGKIATEEALAEKFLKDIFDFKIERGLLYYDSHTWIEPNKGYVKIGIDDFVCKFITKIKQIILPPKSTFLLQDHPFCWIIEESGTIPIICPLSGFIVSPNQELFKNPELPIIDPYGKGWLMRLEPQDFEKQVKSLLSSEDAILKFKSHSLIFKHLFLNNLLKQVKKQGTSILNGDRNIGELKKIIGYKRFFEIFLATFTKLHSNFKHIPEYQG